MKSGRRTALRNRSLKTAGSRSFEFLEPRNLLAASPIISEFMASNEASLLDEDGDASDWIEVYNPDLESIDLNGWHLTDSDGDLTKWTFPPARLGAGEYIVIFASDKNRAVAGQELHTNFKLSASGESLALVQPDGTTIVSAYSPEYPAQQTDISYGQSLDGQERGFFLTPTPGAPNRFDPVADPARRVVINEIMYHPSSENSLDEYIELHNLGPNSVNLNRWSLTRGVDFTFPNVDIPPGGYLVVAADAGTLQAKYPGLTGVVGPWSGQLSNRSETLELADGNGLTMDKLTYADEGDWSLRGRGPDDAGTRGWVWLDEHDGGGKSIELINAAIANQHGQNWAASVTDQGTPGTANSVRSNDVAPLILDVSHSPVIPNSADEVTVTARLLDEADGASAQVAWRVGSTNFSTAPMRDDGLGGDPIAGDGRWTATIPAQPNNTVVEFYVQASDTSGNARTWPAPTLDEGQATNLLYQVDDQFDPEAEWLPGSAPVYYQIMTVAERAEFENINRVSDAEMNATLIAVTGTGIEVRYNAGVRIRGSGSRTDNPPNNRINLPSDRPLQGVSALNLNQRGIQNQIAGSVLFRLAGLPAAEAKAVFMNSNGANLHGDQLYAHVEPLNQDFVSNQFPLDDGGNLYKGRRPDESPPGGLGAGLKYFGEDPAPYVSYDKLTNASQGDWTDVIRLTDALNNSPNDDYVSAIEQVLDIDQWLRFFAMNTLLNNSENGLVTGDTLGDDYAMYRGVADPRFKMVPHDLDGLFAGGNNGVQSTIFAATQVPALGRMLTHPRILPRYYAQLKDLIVNVLTTERAELALTEALRNVSTPGQMQEITDFLQARANYVLSIIPHSQLTVTSGLPLVGEFHRSASAEVALSGSISAETQSVIVNGQQAAITGLDRTWSIGEGTSGQAQTLVPRGATWDYLDDGSDQGTSWRDTDFVPDASWKQGAAELGYGDRDERTTIGFGGNPNNKYITTYFRHEFEILDVSELVALKLSLLRDDGAAIFLNGVEVARDNLPADADFDTRATSAVGGGEEQAFFEFSVDPSRLVIGKNVLAVEVHQANPTSSDVSFDLEFEALLRGDVRGLPLHPGINRFFVEAYERADAAGTPRESQTIDIWYDDGAVQNISGELPGGDTRWTAAEGPYRVSGTAVVPEGATLTIEPGTSVYFEADAGLAVSGTLVAAGTEYDRIRFTSIPNAPLVRDDSSPGLPVGPPHWDGVQFIDSMSPNNLISYADIEYAQDVNGSIGVVNSEAVIDHVTFRGTHLRMVHTDNASVIVQNSTFPDMFAEDEVAADLGLDNVSEHIKGTGTIPAGGHYIVRNNVFGINKGHNDIIDVDSGRRPDPIVQILDNVFPGSGDEAIDLGGDAYIAGNYFMNIFKDDDTSDRGYANAISTGDAGADTTVVVARNVFWDVDHAVNLKNGAATIFENNTVVRIHGDFTDRFGNLNLGSAINFFVDEPGATAGTGAYVAGNIFWDAPRVFGNVDQANTTSALEFHQNLLSPELAGTSVGARPGFIVDLGDGHFVADPRFADELLGEFGLRPGSAALGTGPLGIDMGASAPNRIVVSGQPEGVTGSQSAAITVGGPGMFAFRYRVNGGPWSDALPIGAGYDVNGTVRTAQFQLSGLNHGTQVVEVVGQDFAGQWQAEPTRATWTVDSTTPQLVVSEVLANNVSALDNDGTHPDYVELRNVGGAPVNLNGYRLSDDPNKLAKFTFETDLIVPAGDYVVLYADDLTASPGIHLGFGLDRDGEGVYLSAPVAAGGQVIDAVEFGPQITDLSISRVGPDQAWNLSIATPGTANQPQPTGDPSTLKINEWLASHSELDDFIELYNPDSLPVALEGLYLTDELGGAPTLQQIKPRSYVAGHGFVVLARDRSDNLTFKLSADQEGIALLDQNQNVVDVVFYYPQTHQWSQGRNPDGTNAYGFFAAPSPGRRNVGGIPGDMNFDGVVNAVDIDLLAGAVRQGSTDLAFDFDRNDAVEADDLTFLVESILNTRAGDTDLDGDVDFGDFVALAENFGSAEAGWAQGNFDFDGQVAFADFVSLAANFGFGERLLASSR